MNNSRPLERVLSVAGSGRAPLRQERGGPAPPAGRPGPWPPPPVPSLAIRRARLERFLDEHPDRQVILVRGPAGAGKTVLVSQWVKQHGDPCVWLSIDPQGGLDDRPLRDLVAQASQDPGTRTTLVLDDIHRVSDLARLRRLRQLVDQPPEAVRIMLISRSKPRLALERARLRGDLVEVTPAALRFERAEIEMLIANWAGRHPDPAELEQTTLGWAAGLRLMQLEAAEDLNAPASGLDGPATQYVREELLDGSPDDLGSFLEVTCWLPLLTEPLRLAVTSKRAEQPPLTWSDLEALPILPIASRPGAFRYPPILARVVQQELTRRDPRAAATARRRAGEAARQAGELVTAAELFLQADGADEAAEVCAALATEGEPQLRIVHELLDGLPEATAGNPRWLPWRIRAAVAAGHVDEACRLLEPLDRAGALTDAPGSGRSEDLVMARAVVAEHVGDTTTLLGCAELLLEMADETRPSTSVQQAHGWRVRALVWAGDPERARTAQRAMEHAGIEATPGASAVALARAWLAWSGGDVGVVSEAVAAHRDEGDDVEPALEWSLLAGSVQRERNQLARAVPRFQRAHSLAIEASHRVVKALAASELARCHLAAGAAMEALELVVSTRAAHPELPAWVDTHIRDTEVRVRLDRRDVDGARAALHGAPPGVDTQLMATRVALHQAPGQARELLEAIDSPSPRQAVQKLLLHAQLPDLEEADATAALVAAISAGGHLGLVRTFLDEGPVVSRRLQQLTLESPDHKLGRLAGLVSQELALTPTGGATAVVEPLTPRELAVLRMLPLGMSNREMAAQIYISVNTFKTHVRAIYRKLDVPHRSAAIRRGKALQLV